MHSQMRTSRHGEVLTSRMIPGKLIMETQSYCILGHVMQRKSRTSVSRNIQFHCKKELFCFN